MSDRWLAYLVPVRTITLTFLLLPLLGFGQVTPKALLWKVEGRGLKQPSYVVGTVHSRDARAYGQVPQLMRIMNGQEVLAGELDMEAAGTGSRELLQSMLMPQGKELADLYTEGELKKVRASLAEHLGPVAMVGGRMKPFFLIGLLGETVLRNDSSVVLDQYLQKQARTMGKSVVGLETVSEQMAAVDEVPLAVQAELLYAMVRHNLYRKDMERMMDAYAAQDLGRVAELASGSGMPKSFAEHLLTDRNRVMAERMDSLLQGGRTFLFAIGAGHLPGNNGVLALLRLMGYHAVPVPREVPFEEERRP